MPRYGFVKKISTQQLHTARMHPSRLILIIVVNQNQNAKTKKSESDPLVVIVNARINLSKCAFLRDLCEDVHTLVPKRISAAYKMHKKCSVVTNRITLYLRYKITGFCV